MINHANHKIAVTSHHHLTTAPNTAKISVGTTLLSSWTLAGAWSLDDPWVWKAAKAVGHQYMAYLSLKLELHGSFHSHGGIQKWLVYFRDTPI